MGGSFFYISKRLRRHTCIKICHSLLRTIQPIHCPEHQHVNKIMFSSITHLRGKSQKLSRIYPHLTRQPCRLFHTHIKITALDAGREFLHELLCIVRICQFWIAINGYLIVLICLIIPALFFEKIGINIMRCCQFRVCFDCFFIAFFSSFHISKRLRRHTCIKICHSLLRTIQLIHCPERQHVSKLMLSSIAHLHG